MAERHFLCWRDKDGLRRIEVYDDQDEALEAYSQADSWNAAHGNLELREDVCLFGSDSLATLCRTHASWFAPETIQSTIEEALHADHAQHDADDPS